MTFDKISSIMSLKKKLLQLLEISINYFSKNFFIFKKNCKHIPQQTSWKNFKKL
jgi:hypothetical protein